MYFYGFFNIDRAGSHVRRSESKFDITYITNMILDQTNVKKFVLALPSLAAIGGNEHFRNVLTQFPGFSRCFQCVVFVCIYFCI